MEDREGYILAKTTTQPALHNGTNSKTNADFTIFKSTFKNVLKHCFGYLKKKLY